MGISITHLQRFSVEGFEHPLEVLYCDNHVFAAIKPAGVLSQGDVTGDCSILDISKAWIKHRYNKPGNVFLGLVHRLDRPVCGVMVFGRTSKGAARLSESFRARIVNKTYLALVEGVLHGGSELRNTLDGKECSLTFRCLAQRNGQSLLEVHPTTGRKHQIRRQLALAGYPIVGDWRYGSSSKLHGRRIGLHAHSLTIPHPTTGESLSLTAPQPAFILPTDMDETGIK